MLPFINKIALICFCAIIVPFMACSNKETENSQQEQKPASYQCPMKCSDELYTKFGSCNVCGMELEQIDPS